MGAGQMAKRIPRIKFPSRHPNPNPNPSVSGSISSSMEFLTIVRSSSHVQVIQIDGDSQQHLYFSRNSVPAAPINTAVGGKASLQPKRTPVTDREIEAILLGGCF